MRFAVVVGISALTLLPGGLVAGGKGQERTFEQLQKKLSQYEALKEKAARGLDKPGKEAAPEQVDAYKQELRTRIAAARGGAKPGDILSPSIFDLLAAVRSETEGAGGHANKDAILSDGNPAEEGHRFQPRVNAAYPPEAPRSTVPPDVLARLPELPENLQFRFVGRTLILYDVEADLILDYVTGVVKGAARR
jgi:hypothetical protein